MPEHEDNIDDSANAVLADIVRKCLKMIDMLGDGYSRHGQRILELEDKVEKLQKSKSLWQRLFG